MKMLKESLKKLKPPEESPSKSSKGKKYKTCE